MAPRAARLSRFLETSGATMKIEIAEARGSTPRESGAWMLVAEDEIHGTIGGGRLEMMAIDAARRRLSGADDATTMTIALGPEIGQCCGGHVTLRLVPVDTTTAQDLVAKSREVDAALPEVYVFGAGHVGKALALALSPLPLRTIVAETRQEALETVTGEVERRLLAMPETIVESARPQAAFVVLTHDHALDFLIVHAALARNDAAYVGMIGSKTKRASYASWHVREAKGRREDVDRLTCPIGGNALHDKRPEVIAALAAAEVMIAVGGSQP